MGLRVAESVSNDEIVSISYHTRKFHAIDFHFPRLRDKVIELLITREIVN